MKMFALTILATLSVSAFADPRDTNLEKRHMDLIEKAVKEKCSLRRGSVKPISTKVTAHKIDQGITDYSYVTVVEATDRVDQGVTDLYLVEVKSDYADMYDHTNKDWGVYSVLSVGNCELL